MNEILAKIRHELEAQPAPRTYEVARALSVLDDFESRPSAPALAPFDKLVEEWRKELREVDSDRDNYSPPSADYFAARLSAVVEEVRGK